MSCVGLQLKTIPDYSKLSIDDALQYRGSVEQSEERAQKHDHAAAIYNHVCCSSASINFFYFYTYRCTHSLCRSYHMNWWTWHSSDTD